MAKNPVASTMSRKKGGTTSQKGSTTTPSSHKCSKKVASSDNESSSSEEEQRPPKKKAWKVKKKVVNESGGEGSESDKDDEVIIVKAGVLQQKHVNPIPSTHKVKKDSSKDILTIFSDRLKAKFVTGQQVEEIRGCWCKICKVDKNFIQTQGKCKAFHTGSNSLCCQYIWQHYEIYKAWCAEKDMVEHHWSIPCDIWREMEESKTEKKKIIQYTLKFEKVQGV
ncbi:hypothetical protein H0H87_011486 [Tephrocybe sp. NHM501043]|nr:hypothetical protein H0H87_011486 [Tephrocybe sp. NHM501043]